MEFEKGVCEQFGEIMQRLVQIEGIPSVAVGWENTNNYYAGHMYVLSYDKDSKSGYVLTRQLVTQILACIHRQGK